MRIILGIIALFYLSLSGLAQQFNFKKYGLEEGLPRVGVYDIHQDHEGYLWVGTEGGGICRFDGIEFQSFTRRNGLPSDNIREILQTPDKVLWVATEEGVCYFNGTDFVQVALSDSVAEEQIRTIYYRNDGTLLVGSDKGISWIDYRQKIEAKPKSFAYQIPDSTVRAYIVYNDTTWVGTDSGLYKIQGNTLVPYYRQNELASFRILGLYEDSKGNLWIGTAGGLNCLLADGTIQTYTTSEGLVFNRVRTVLEDRYGNIWIATSRGLNILDNGEMITITSANGLTNDRIRCLTIDSFDNIWVGTFFGGIVRYNYKDFTGFTTAEGLGSNQVQAVTVDEYGDVLVGTNAGFSQLEVLNNKLYNYSTLNLSDSYLGNSVKAVYYDKQGYTWLGTNQGITIVKLDYKKEIIFQSLKSEVKNVGVTAIREFRDKFFVGTTQGLYQIRVVGNYQSFEVVNLSANNKMGGEEVSSIISDGFGRVWIGFSDGTVSVYDQTRIVTPASDPKFELIVSMAADSSGNLWFGTNGNGLFCGTYDSQNKRLNLKNYSTNEKLSSNYIYSILLTEDKIWLGHERGLDILIGSADSVSTIINCGSEIGFKGLQNSANAAVQDANGNIWFGTINGLYRLNGRELNSFLTGTPPIIHLRGLKINSAEVDWPESDLCDTVWSSYKLPVNLNLPYDKNNLDFEFIALNYIAPEKIKYSWKLEGFDEDWHIPTSENHAQYTNLPAGIFTFRLRASNELGIIQPEEQTLTFIIHKPFWEEWWFRILAGGFVALMVVVFMRWRNRQLIANQKRLESIIEVRTQEIKSQNELLEEKNKEITDSIFYSRRIQRSVLPAKEKVAKLLEKYFIFFRPKDIVSGDFYWAERSLDRKQIYFAVADCTGHGVPGAMVSLIGTRALNTALREVGLTTPADILEHVNDSMIESFTDGETGTVIKDGMDIALCSIEYTDGNDVHFQYAGAQNSVWIVRAESEPDLVVNGETLESNLSLNGFKLFEIKADKQPIGYFEPRVPFKNKSSLLKKGDRVYLYSDGFADQFGGEKGKKFKYKTLKELILSSQEHPASEHYSIIRNAFYDWKREFEQIDDVCVMGVEI